MRKAIKVHNFRTAINELWEVNCKPQTTLKIFDEFQTWWNGDSVLSELDADHPYFYYLWEKVEENTTYIGEVEPFNFKGCRLFQKNRPSTDYFYDGWKGNYQIIGSFNFPV